ncbi:MAG: hypothetical protein EZS28_005183 [Streblomastix strix]|uniref:Uncharacterized protein n=1 Tax=Streblomastix strix TaxID=222440 RepID=A0A5J4WW93_9EUKA|nr:MAG: hypothetical protein EZS28_005183 [Streblomastix strix]
MLISIIPDKEHVYQEGCKIIRTNIQGVSTVAFDPIISSGIVRFGGFFENHIISNFSFGIADSSAVFGSNEDPSDGENVEVQIESEGGKEEINSFVVYTNQFQVNVYKEAISLQYEMMNGWIGESNE